MELRDGGLEGEDVLILVGHVLVDVPHRLVRALLGRQGFNGGWWGGGGLALGGRFISLSGWGGWVYQKKG